MRVLDSRPIQALLLLRLPRDERSAAKAELRAEAEIRRERDNVETADRRAAAIEAESRRYQGYGRYG
jgi:hypothetical protein